MAKIQPPTDAEIQKAHEALTDIHGLLEEGKRIVEALNLMRTDIASHRDALEGHAAAGAGLTKDMAKVLEEARTKGDDAVHSLERRLEGWGVQAEGFLRALGAEVDRAPGSMLRSLSADDDEGPSEEWAGLFASALKALAKASGHPVESMPELRDLVKKLEGVSGE